MGSRLLADWLANPLTNLDEIQRRQEAIAELLESATLRRELRSFWGAYSTGTADCSVTRDAPVRATQLHRARWTACRRSRAADAAQHTAARLARHSAGTVSRSARALESSAGDNCPLLAREGGFIRGGFHDELDRLRELAAAGSMDRAVSGRRGQPNGH